MYFTEEDKQELVDEVSITTVIEALGLETKRIGNSLSILCPIPTHTDNHFGSCIVTANHFFCYVCEEGGNTIDLLMMAGGKTLYEAVKELAYLSGHPERYGKQRNKNELLISSKKMLSQEDKALLGLTPRRDKRTLPVLGLNAWRIDTATCIRDLNGDYLVLGKNNISLRTLLVEDPDTYDWLIRNKCKEVLQQNKNVLEALELPHETELGEKLNFIISELHWDINCLCIVLRENIDRITAIYETSGGKKYLL